MESSSSSSSSKPLHQNPENGTMEVPSEKIPHRSRRSTTTTASPALVTLLLLLLAQASPTLAQDGDETTQRKCEPCEGTPTGFALKPGTSCREYVNCQDGVEAQSQSCNGGLVFDLNIKGCNWDYMVTCPSDEELWNLCPEPEPEPVVSGGEGGGEGGGGGGLKCENPLCEMGFNGMATVPYSDCVDYVMCSNGVPGTVMSCPSGQRYDTRIQACNIVAQVTNCPPDPTCPPSVSPTLAPTSVPSVEPSSESTEEPTPSPVTAVKGGGGGGVNAMNNNNNNDDESSLQSKKNLELLEGMYVIDAHIAANKILIARELLTSPYAARNTRRAASSSSSSLFTTSTSFTYMGFKESLHTMITTPVENQTFYIGEAGPLNGRVYGLVNIAAFLAMSASDSIHVGSCDEVNTDIVGGYLPISNACGQNHLDYQAMTCPPEDEKYACPIDNTMQAYASIAIGSGAGGSGGGSREEKPPMPFYCGPAESYGGYTGHWDYISETENRDRPIENQLGRQDVEGCCWWGRGSIHIRGPCAYGKLNYHLGKRAADEGRPSMFPDVDFCANPSAVCSHEKYPDLKWIAGMFRWITEIQSYETQEFSYMERLKGFVDGGLRDWGFIHGVAGIVTQGCHEPPCVEGAEFRGVERKAMFVKTLKLFGLVVDDGVAMGRRLEEDEVENGSAA